MHRITSAQTVGVHFRQNSTLDHAIAERALEAEGCVLEVEGCVLELEAEAEGCALALEAEGCVLALEAEGCVLEAEGVKTTLEGS